MSTTKTQSWVSIDLDEALSLMDQGSYIYAFLPMTGDESAFVFRRFSDMSGDGGHTGQYAFCKDGGTQWTLATLSDLYVLSFCTLYLNPSDPECLIQNYTEIIEQAEARRKARQLEASRPKFMIADLAQAFHYAFHHRPVNMKSPARYKLSQIEQQLAEQEVRRILLDGTNGIPLPMPPAHSFVWSLAKFLDEEYESHC